MDGPDTRPLHGMAGLRGDDHMRVLPPPWPRPSSGTRGLVAQGFDYPRNAGLSSVSCLPVLQLVDQQEVVEDHVGPVEIAQPAIGPAVVADQGGAGRQLHDAGLAQVDENLVSLTT